MTDRSLPSVRRPAERRTVLQLLLGILLYVACQVVLAAVVAGLHAPLGGTEALSIGEAITAPGPAGPIAFAAAALVAIGGFVLLIRFVSGRRVFEFSAAGAGRELAIGLGVGAGIVGLAVLLLTLIGVYRPTGFGLSAAIVSGIMIGVGPAVVEEIVFRGVLLRILDNWIGSWAALAVVSVLFGLVHGGSSPAGPIAALFVFLQASLILNVAFLLTRRLWLAIGLHLAFNATQSAVFGLAVTGSASNGSLVTADLVGPDLLTGGALGGEGSIVTVVVALLAGIVMLVVAVRRGVMLPPARRREKVAS